MIKSVFKYIFTFICTIYIINTKIQPAENIQSPIIAEGYSSFSNKPLYVAQRPHDTDLSFGIVRLTEENYPIWLNACEKQYDECIRIWEEHDNRLRDENKEDEFYEINKNTNKFLKFICISRPCGNSIESGLMAFKQSLKIYNAYKSEIWIAYALSGNIDPTQAVHEGVFHHIEMMMTVLTSPDASFTGHMGITRTVFHEEQSFQSKLVKHKNLAIPLHAFSASVMKTIYPEKKCMRTDPTFDMYDVFIKSLPSKAYIPHEKVSEYFRENVIPQPNRAEEKWYWYTKHFYLGKSYPRSIMFDLAELANMFPTDCIVKTI
ncbi:MAG: hypothetical protein C0432_00385 [Candidatus Puniceispirillum sp.]|nr:hypothetical protein [Candidatus Pelagibacter sp.]MBA4282740.1 hypothetical protein [Candidatus Puniceispirillum sp.]